MNVLTQIKEGSIHKNVSDTERAVSTALGLAALGYAIAGRRGRVTALLGGASLLFRGATGFCSLYKAAGINTACSANQEPDHTDSRLSATA